MRLGLRLCQGYFVCGQAHGFRRTRAADLLVVLVAIKVVQSGTCAEAQRSSRNVCRIRQAPAILGRAKPGDGAAR
jgi:hypothetical protein